VTLEEYAQEIADELRRAHASRNLATVSPIFHDADHVLADSKISDADQRRFWQSVRTNLGEVLLVEKQANSALLTLMQAIQREIQTRLAS